MLASAERKIAIPAGVEAAIDRGVIRIRGKGTEQTRAFDPNRIMVSAGGKDIRISYDAKGRKCKMYANTIEAHIRNMLLGLEKGYVYRLEVVYSHFPMNIAIKGNFVEISNFLGAKSPKKARIVGATKVELKGQAITVSGMSKEDTGQTAANIEIATRVSGRDRRIFQDGIYIVSKGTEGK